MRNGWECYVTQWREHFTSDPEDAKWELERLIEDEPVKGHAVKEAMHDEYLAEFGD